MCIFSDDSFVFADQKLQEFLGPVRSNHLLQFSIAKPNSFLEFLELGERDR